MVTRLGATGILLASMLAGMNHSGLVQWKGEPMPGATVRATLGDLKAVTTTDESGLYVFGDLPSGKWVIEVEMFGFASLRREVTIGAMPTAETWNLELRQRTARAPAGAQPADGFQNLDLSEWQPETEAPPPAQPAAPPEDANEAFLVSGTLSRALEQPPPREDPAEQQGIDWSKRILQDNADAAAARAAAKPVKRAAVLGPGGRKAGFSMKGAAARAGVNFGNKRNRARDAVRGSAYYTLRDSLFDARPYSLSGQTLDKPDYSYGRFGVTAGGPLAIPKLFRSDSTFFYFDYSGTRSRNPYNVVSTLPAPAERAGDFSQSVMRAPVTIYDPTTRQPFPENRIPASRVDAAALGLLALMPLPNQPGRVQNYQFVTTVTQNTGNLSARLNQRLTRYDRLAFSLNRQSRDGEGVQLYGFRDQHDGSGLNSDLSWSHNFGPRFIYNVRYRFNQNRTYVLPYFAYGRDVAGELGIHGTSRDPINFGPPNLSFTNFGGLADAQPTLRRDRSSSVTEGLTVVRKKHSVQLGGEYRRNQINSRTVQNGRGSFSFSGLLTSALDAKGNPLPGTGFDFADFLLGFPQSSSIRFGAENTYFRETVGSAFIQDDWRARPNLSFSLGLRWEYFTPYREKFERMANLDIASGFTGAAVVIPRMEGPYTGVFPPSLINHDKNNVAPRIGIAWRPFKKKHQNIRAGWGIYYNGSIYNQFAVRLASQPPFATAAATQSTSVARPLSIADGLATAPAAKVTNTYAIDRYYRVGYAQTWNLSIQQELPRSLVLEIGYLGTKGTKLDIQRLPNRAAPGSPLTAEQRRQIGNAVGFTFESAEGNSIYNAAHVRLTRRFRKGMSSSLLYTWSKTIDNASTFGGGGNVVAQNDRDLRSERGLSSFDQRHQLTANYMITSPFGEGAAPLRATGLRGRLLKDWTLSGILTAHSGTPLTARVLGNRADSGGTGVIGSGRAEATGLPIDGDRFFNLAAFGLPLVGRFGNAGRNTIPGPGFVSANLSFGRAFRLHERRYLDFRIDSSNFMNHANFTSLGSVVNALNYGLPTYAAPMRSVTTTLRFRF